MKLWLISQDYNRGYDTYDSAVVVALDEDAARKTNPCPFGSTSTWCDPRYVNVQYIGEAREGMPVEVVCASFNAG